MLEPSRSIIIRTVCSAVTPFIQIFGAYVIVHGHYSPGGGFQGGVILASSIILERLYIGKDLSHRQFPPEWAPALAAGGMLIFMIVGLVPLATGGMFLDYGHLPIPGLSGDDLRYYGILIVEVAIGLAVFGTVVLIFDKLVEGMR